MRNSYVIHPMVDTTRQNDSDNAVTRISALGFQYTVNRWIDLTAGIMRTPPLILMDRHECMQVRDSRITYRVIHRVPE